MLGLSRQGHHPDDELHRLLGAVVWCGCRTRWKSRFPRESKTAATRLIEGAGNRTRPDKPAGDLELLVQVDPHPFFSRDGDDLLCTVPVTSRGRGARRRDGRCPSLAGKLKVRVPPSTQPGSMLRIKGKGAPHRYRAGRGDQLVTVNVEVPTSLTPRAQRLIEELGQELGEDVHPQQRTLVEKLKGFFG